MVQDVLQELCAYYLGPGVFRVWRRVLTLPLILVLLTLVAAFAARRSGRFPWRSAEGSCRLVAFSMTCSAARVAVLLHVLEIRDEEC